jgi:hypothetical protein
MNDQALISLPLKKHHHKIPDIIEKLCMEERLSETLCNEERLSEVLENLSSVASTRPSLPVVLCEDTDPTKSTE